jgi:general secretion pathway protein D
MDAKKLFAVIVLGTAATATAAPVSTSTTLILLPSSLVAQTNDTTARRQSDELLRLARSAMREGRLDMAEKHLAEAESLKVSYTGLLQRFADTPAKVRKDLEKLAAKSGRGPVDLDDVSAASDQASESAADSPQHLPPGVDQSSRPISPRRPGQLITNPFASGADAQGPAAETYPETPFPAYAGTQRVPLTSGSPLPATPAVRGSIAKQQALQLLSQAKMELARGQIDRAEELCQQAHQLRVPDTEFGPNEERPWMLLLQIDRARRQTRGQVVTADRDFGKSSPYDASRAVYQGQDAGPGVQPAAGTQLDSDDPGQQPEPGPVPVNNPFASDPARAETSAPGTPSASDLLRQGEEALKARDVGKARDLFQQAWKQEGELDIEARQRLQDHLQLLGIQSSQPRGSGTNAERLTAGEQAIVRRFVSEISQEQDAVERALPKNPKEAWNRLKQLRTKIEDAEIPDSARQQLLARVERSIQSTQKFIEQNRNAIEQDDRNREVLAQIDRERQHRIELDQKLTAMVDEFNMLMDQQRYPEAVVLAKKANELAPNTEIAESMVWKSRFAERLMVELSLRDRMQQGVELALRQTSESAIPYDERNLLEFPNNGDVHYWQSLTGRRTKQLERLRRQPSEAEIEIYRALREKVRVNYENKSLGQVLDDLAGLAGISIYLDPNGLAVEGITSDMPVTFNSNQEIMLQSVLNLILERFHLKYVIQDEVLKVTSEDISDKEIIQQTYDVANLVIPIPNFPAGYESGMAGGIREAFNAQRPLSMINGQVTVQPDLPLAYNQNGALNKNVLAQVNSPGTMTNGSAGPAQFGPGGMGGAAEADFDALIDLIVTTIEPDSWDEVGGPGSIQGFEGTLSLVVSNTQEVHEQIVDLLEQLRRQQDLQVTIEVRFITLNDNFFERIGVDFDFDIDDNVVVNGVPGTGANIGNIIPDDGAPSVTIGLDPQGNPTADLDLAFSQGSFASAVPAFGGFDPATAATFGFAILSDIEAFFLIEAAQGDSRTNVLQAPKVTLFNGQLANVTDISARPFVTSVTPVVADFAVAQQPIILVLNEGTQLTVQAVVSPDRRFVRLTLIPFFSDIGDVEEFTFEGRRSSNTGTTNVDPTDETDTVQDDAEETFEGTTVQLPQFATTSISTTVSVPDGGTILLGGIKRLSEGRNENGVPILSKIPYINRLFKNVGIGRQTQSLMMMVTPRIIIQEEEEERLVGTTSP